MNDVTMGNQQATATELAWLAGLWDGEGSFFITKNGPNSKYQVRISFTTTSERLLAKVTEIVEKMGLSSYINGNRALPKCKPIYYLYISSMSNMIPFSKAILPYLVEKDAQAKLLIRFMESRLSHGKRHGRSCPYTEEEDQMVLTITALNKRGASETTCQAPVKDEDIVRTAAKSAESGRNDLTPNSLVVV